MKRYITAYLPGYSRAIIYMLQSTEYHFGPYLQWYKRVKTFKYIAKRRALENTSAARLLLLALRSGMIIQFALGVLIILYGINHQNSIWMFILGAMIMISYPFVWARLIILPLVIAKILIITPREKKFVDASSKIFKEHPAVIIGVAGNYGKTTVKELLGTVLGNNLNVAITPANKNTAISHARFASTLNGDEEVLVIEYGEGKPGDVALFAQTTHPSIGVITGIAPAHLDQYPTLAAAESDIFSLATHLHDTSIYLNGESPVSEAWQKESYTRYSQAGIGKLHVSDIDVSYEGVKFTLSDQITTLKIQSALLGRHMIGPLSLTAQIALDLGLSVSQIELAISQTQPFEHRMKPRRLAGGWIIDDTYNGNLEGIRAGLTLLAELPASRKVYVTPGLVDQGDEHIRVHVEIGNLIAEANPDSIVLMQNSSTIIIEDTLKNSEYKGMIIIENDPLNYYMNIEHHIAAGDLIMMQNDWTDNYS